MSEIMKAGRLVLPRWLEYGLRLILGGVFIYASIHKIAHPADFARSIANYHMTPYVLLHPMALFLPWLEMVCGLALVSGFRMRGAAWILAVMLVVFIVAIASAMAQGLDISCGCFDTGNGHKVGFSLIMQDSALLLATLILIYGRRIIR